jgi:hypothetical protein
MRAVALATRAAVRREIIKSLRNGTQRLVAAALWSDQFKCGAKLAVHAYLPAKVSQPGVNG